MNLKLAQSYHNTAKQQKLHSNNAQVSCQFSDTGSNLICHLHLKVPRQCDCHQNFSMMFVLRMTAVTDAIRLKDVFSRFDKA